MNLVVILSDENERMKCSCTQKGFHVICYVSIATIIKASNGGGLGWLVKVRRKRKMEKSFRKFLFVKSNVFINKQKFKKSTSPKNKKEKTNKFHSTQCDNGRNVSKRYK